MTDGSTTVSRTSSVTVHSSNPMVAGTAGGAGGRVTIAAVAATFGSAVAVCNALLFIPGTHNIRETVTDQWVACDGVAQAGGTAEAAIRAAIGTLVGVAAALGGQSLLDALENYIWINYGNQPPPPGPIDPPVAPPPTAPPPTHTPTPVAGAIDDVAAALRARAVALTAEEADTIARECLYRVGQARLTAEALCQSLPIFSPGANYPTATEHRIEALTSWPAWVRLTSRIGARSRWYEQQPECSGSTELIQCDEFPENRTYEGGDPGTTNHRPSLKKIPQSDNGGLGASFGAFRISCSLADGESFLVIPTMSQPTRKVCG